VRRFRAWIVKVSADAVRSEVTFLMTSQASRSSGALHSIVSSWAAISERRTNNSDDFDHPGESSEDKIEGLSKVNSTFAAPSSGFSNSLLSSSIIGKDKQIINRVSTAANRASAQTQFGHALDCETKF